MTQDDKRVRETVQAELRRRRGAPDRGEDRRRGGVESGADARPEGEVGRDGARTGDGRRIE